MNIKTILTLLFLFELLFAIGCVVGLGYSVFSTGLWTSSITNIRDVCGGGLILDSVAMAITIGCIYSLEDNS